MMNCDFLEAKLLTLNPRYQFQSQNGAARWKLVPILYSITQIQQVSKHFLHDLRAPLRILQKDGDSFPSNTFCLSENDLLIARRLQQSLVGEAASCQSPNKSAHQSEGFLVAQSFQRPSFFSTVAAKKTGDRKLKLLAGNMSNEVKSDAITGLDGKGPELGYFDKAAELGEKVSVTQRAWDGFYRPVSNTLKPTEYRYSSERFSKGTREAQLDIVPIAVDGNERREHRSGKQSGPLLSGTAYCISSCGMILLNKIVLSSYAFNAGISLMFYQNFISTVVVVVLGFCGAVTIEKPNQKLINLWIPVNLIFIGMLVSGMYSLKHINIAMVTILKNVTNILTAIGEFYIFRKRQNEKVWTAMFLMIISAISGGITDLSFNATGYVWKMINCILTASYSLTLRRVMDKAKHLTKSGSLNEVSMVLLNNSLSLPFALCLIFLFDEWDYIINAEVIRMPMFWVVATASGLLGLAISFTSMWFLNQTGPTTYSLVGSLNKIPISIAGLMLFKVPLSLPSFFSILFGLFAGILFAMAKMS